MRKKIVLIVVGVIIGIVLGEITLRIISTKVKKRTARTHKSVDESVFTIFCFGDSVTYGVGDETGKGYPKRLGNILRGKLNIEVGVFNMGVPGASTVGVLTQLGECIEAFPDINLSVILVGSGNSLWNLKEMYKEIIQYPLTVKEIICISIDKFLSKSRLYLLLKLFFEDIGYKKRKRITKEYSKEYRECLEKATWERFLIFRDIEQNLDICNSSQFNNLVNIYNKCIAISPECEDAYLGLLGVLYACEKDVDQETSKIILSNPQSRRLFKKLKYPKCRNLLIYIMYKNIKEMIEICKDKGINVLFMNYPSGGLGEIDYIIRRLCEKKNITYIDMLGYFKNELKCDGCPDYFVDDIHLNSNGYFVMAEKIAEKIEEMFFKK